MNKFKKHDLNKAPNELAKEILNMVNNDQEARFSNSENLREIDINNTKRMKEIVAKVGWPTIEMVGEEASNCAWLLVQHADQELDFQIKCLDLMKKLPEGQILKKNIAYLEDRVRVSKGQPTLYGTQFYRREYGKLVPREIEDPENINKRRKDAGLNTMEEYIEFFYKQCPEDSVPEEYLN